MLDIDDKTLYIIRNAHLQLNIEILSQWWRGSLTKGLKVFP